MTQFLALRQDFENFLALDQITSSTSSLRSLLFF